MLFPEGDYLVIDPEVRKGLPPVAFFTVSPARGPAVAEPEADYSIEAGDFYFEVPDPSPVRPRSRSPMSANRATRWASAEGGEQK